MTITKTKRQLRAEAVEQLKNCVAARFDAESIVIALTSGRRGQSDWSLECDKLIYLLTDDANDDSTPEKVVRTASVDANDVKVSTMPLKMPSEIRWHYTDGGEYTQKLAGDSREKLEADVRKHYAYSTTTLMYPPSANKTTDMLRALPVDTVIGWLDRQAAITKRETLHDNPTCSGRNTCAANRPTSESADHETTKTSEIGASKDEIRDVDVWNVAYEIYCAGGYVDNGNEPNPPTDGIRKLLDRQAAITAEEAADAWEEYVDATQREITELQARVDELQAITDEWWNKYIVEHLRADTLADDLLTANRQREQYRKLFGMALDWAHEITMLETGIDEGMA